MVMSVNSALRQCRRIFTQYKPLRNNIIRCQTTAPTEQVQHEEKTHFGFKDVTKEEKAQNVYGVFSSVADRYDIMNDVMSGGIHRLWKDDFVKTLSPLPGMKILDVAGGTGDISFRMLEHMDQYSGYKIYKARPTEVKPQTEESDGHIRPSTNVVVCDFNADMLRVGEMRAKERKIDDKLSWVQGDAMDLPFENDTFDAYTIAFGIRNVVSVEKALQEAYRVLKKGGRFLCLEFSNVENPLIRWVYDQYSFQLIPVMGQVIAGDWKSYQYLVESIRRFPNQQHFAEMLKEAGFRLVSYKNNTFGVSAVHVGFKL